MVVGWASLGAGSDRADNFPDSGGARRGGRGVIYVSSSAIANPPSRLSLICPVSEMTKQSSRNPIRARSRARQEQTWSNRGLLMVENAPYKRFIQIRRVHFIDLTIGESSWRKYLDFKAGTAPVRKQAPRPEALYLSALGVCIIFCNKLGSIQSFIYSNSLIKKTCATHPASTRQSATPPRQLRHWTLRLRQPCPL